VSQGVIRWQTGFGDDPALAAQGIHGAGVTQMRNSIIVTAGGLLFGFGRDSTIYAFDADTGMVVWPAPLGGALGVRSSPLRYELDRRAYLLVPIGGPNAGRCAAGAGPDLPHPGAPKGFTAERRRAPPWPQRIRAGV
jgi:quinoprotein glucose dehydrogenase